MHENHLIWPMRWLLAFFCFISTAWLCGTTCAECHVVFCLVAQNHMLIKCKRRRQKCNQMVWRNGLEQRISLPVNDKAKIVHKFAMTTRFPIESAKEEGPFWLFFGRNRGHGLHANLNLGEDKWQWVQSSLNKQIKIESNEQSANWINALESMRCQKRDVWFWAWLCWTQHGRSNAVKMYPFRSQQILIYSFILKWIERGRPFDAIYESDLCRWEEESFIIMRSAPNFGHRGDNEDEHGFNVIKWIYYSNVNVVRIISAPWPMKFLRLNQDFHIFGMRFVRLPLFAYLL